MVAGLLRLVSCAGLFLAAGCQTMSPEALALADDQKCQSAGAILGSGLYVECRLLLAEQHEAEAFDRRQKMAEAILEAIDTAYGLR